jgi:two-component system OmpR family sensor kinase
MSLRARHVLATSAITLFTLGAAFAAVSLSMSASQERQLDRALLREAHEEAAEAAALGGDELAISARPGPAANDVGPLTKFAALYADSGDVLAHTPSWRGAPPPLAALPDAGDIGFDLWTAEEHLRGVHVVVPAHPGVHLLLAAPRADLDGDERILARAMATVFGIAVLWTVLAMIAVVWRLTRGHRAIVSVARRVAAGDLEARIHMRRGDPEVVQLARDIDAMIDRLGLLIGLQQRFIANAAHELRSPLTTLYGELAHALRRSRAPEDYAQAIREALDAAMRLRRLTEDLLEVARVGAGDMLHAPIDLAALAREAIALVADEATDRGVTIAWHGNAVASGRPGDLVRLLRNLLENAVRHAPAGTTVDLRCTAAAGRVRLTIRDAGPGVPDGEQARVFEAFYRGPRERADGGGTGLGLTIAREIARAHGGELTLQKSGPGSGACFVLELPGATSAAPRSRVPEL